MLWPIWIALFIAACWAADWLWQRHKARRAAKIRAIDIEWLHELSEAYVNGTGGADNLRYLVKHIESDYDAYANDFPNLEDRLAEARTALLLSPMSEDLAALNAALGDEAARLGSESDKSRLG